jgi:predicted P-loop ATPase
MAAVRRVRQPGCKYDEMLVLESAQGLNKSSALRALCPNEEWFSDDLPLNVDAKQIIERTLGKWIIEASDLSGMRPASVEHLKAMLSRQVDGPARMAYGHLPIERRRQFILVGSTNSRDYLKDPTGARRFWPVEVVRFSIEGILKDRDQLWAEAAVREAAGESIRLHESLWAEAGLEQEKRRQVDAWEDDLADFVENCCPGSDGKKRILSSSIWEAIGIEKARRDRVLQNRIGEIMHRLGFVHSKIRVGEKTESGYVSQVFGSLPL